MDRGKPWKESTRGSKPTMRKTLQREDLFEVFDPRNKRVFGPLGFREAQKKLRELRKDFQPDETVKKKDNPFQCGTPRINLRAIRRRLPRLRGDEKYMLYDADLRKHHGPFERKELIAWVKKVETRERSGSCTTGYAIRSDRYQQRLWDRATPARPLLFFLFNPWNSFRIL